MEQYEVKDNMFFYNFSFNTSGNKSLKSEKTENETILNLPTKRRKDQPQIEHP